MSGPKRTFNIIFVSFFYLPHFLQYKAIPHICYNFANFNTSILLCMYICHYVILYFKTRYMRGPKRPFNTIFVSFFICLILYSTKAILYYFLYFTFRSDFANRVIVLMPSCMPSFHYTLFLLRFIQVVQKNVCFNSRVPFVCQYFCCHERNKVHFNVHFLHIKVQIP